MTSVDFAAAQQRIAERRQLRAVEARARLESQRNIHATSALNRLPFGVGQRGLEAWDIIKGREGTRPAFRVGQVDAELLDEELLELLKGQVGEGLKYFGVWYIVSQGMARALTFASHTCETSGRPRSSLASVPSCSNYRSGTTTRHTVPLCRTFATQMLVIADLSSRYLKDGRKLAMVYSQWEGVMAGPSGKTGSQIRKGATIR